MAESTATVTYLELKKAVGFYFGYGRDTTLWSASQLAHIQDTVRRGERQVVYPPPAIGKRLSHEWSWLRPVRTLDLVAPYSTGTVEVVNGDATVTLTGGTWPSWAASGEIVISGSLPMTIATRTNDTSIELDVAWSGDSATLQTYTAYQHDYQLPDNVQSVQGPLTYQPGAGPCQITLVPESMMRINRQGARYRAGAPRIASVRPLTSAVTGQRSELSVYPSPNQAYRLLYCGVLIVNSLSADGDFPPGGSYMAELYTESCLAIAESQQPIAGQPIDLHRSRFMELLASSVSVDSRTSSPGVIAYNGDGMGLMDDPKWPDPSIIITHDGKYTGP